MFHPCIVLRLVEHALGCRLPLGRVFFGRDAMRDDQLEVSNWRVFFEARPTRGFKKGW